MKKVNSKTAIQCAAFVCALIILSQVCMAGNLEPNAPPGSTMKPLDQVEPRIPITSVPYTISTSGSYYLTKNLTISGSTSAIIVSANDVTIDLCGYTLAGPDTGANFGVTIFGQNNVEIRNGTVRDFYYGIYTASLSNQTRIVGVRSVSNTYGGIYIGLSNNSVVKDCTVSDNGNGTSGTAYGITVGTNSIVTGNTVYNTGNSALTGFSVYGISANNGSIVSGNTVSNNGLSAASGTNVYGVYVASGCTVNGNILVSNGFGGSGTVFAIYAGSIR